METLGIAPRREQARTIRIAAADGFELASTEFAPDATPRAVVVINAATGVKRRYYERFAQYLAAHGFAVVTYDYRGVGDSRPRALRGFNATMRQWAELDQTAVVAHATAWQPAVPLLLVGHSVGGQIFGLLPDPHRVQRVLMVAAQHNYYGLWRPPHRWILWSLWHVLMPATSHALGFFPSSRLGLGEDLPQGVALDWAKWCRSPGALVEAIGGDARQRFAEYRGRILALSFHDDQKFAPRPAVDALLTFYRNATAEHRHLAPSALGLREVGHFGYFREPARALGWPVALEWLRGALH